ncbi:MULTISPECIES: dihydrofolate reductase family protein [Methanoculleus]|mgnify:CR=1 FL=1|jgi:2,5-diamino-6-(ribosylamino)-4(3H)-pyrimidinone 5'-phosphate reductase|uniref:2,5-diamino-6-(Ribosylamino)-4(3H)-pyrimidinone 5'-phosphate reductase n=1 Tax=Methanoculleus thermophilus TaxID=2200 RepID=A0A1G8ZBM7_9EURY|nr:MULTISPECIES: dihydrofolate reductase family protein [Methanoculleus]NLN08793.1 5-amino-6-(5-phosphoribosylamino)uracil reductase [Methanoculleus thermophilus]SDK12064.1 2,5-diamino-6-(ribosylamino)-4(3H)-pyrimidinone 5'-phosphate reductase [Methanoculleus thermophilus]HQD26936.1 dihydrofolate reductase family protein [Methanoculleus thermophilus]
MYPEVIIHNSVSLDHAVRGFEVDLGLHYGVLQALKPGAVLAGSATAKSGIEIYQDINEPETEADRHRPEVRQDDPRPIFVIVDSRGVLKDLLHFYRKMEHTKDVVVLVSEATPESYLDYLREREYPFIRCGRSRVDLRGAILELGERFGITRVVSDSGPDLNDVLIQEGIADTISLIVHPVIVGGEEKRLFCQVGGPVTLELQKAVPMEGGTVHLTYTLKD